jgi:hypothetical protein
MPWQLDEYEIQVWKSHTRKTLISNADAVNEVKPYTLNPAPYTLHSIP